MRNKMSTKEITTIGLLSSIAFVLMFFEGPIPLFPRFLNLDISEVPVLIGTFMMGPLAGILIELIKNLLHLTVSRSADLGIGELANFLVGTAYIIPAGIIYKRQRDLKGMIKGMVAGVFVMSIFAAAANYFIFLPLYASVVYHVKIADFVGYAAVPHIQSVFSLIIVGILPFNILKGTLSSVLTALIYTKLSSFVNLRAEKPQKI